MGNHEHAVLYGAFGFHAAAKRAVDWTRETLQSSPQKKVLWELLENLPLKHQIGEPGFVQPARTMSAIGG